MISARDDCLHGSAGREAREQGEGGEQALGAAQPGGEKKRPNLSIIQCVLINTASSSSFYGGKGIISSSHDASPSIIELWISLSSHSHSTHSNTYKQHSPAMKFDSNSLLWNDGAAISHDLGKLSNYIKKNYWLNYQKKSHKELNIMLREYYCHLKK